MSCLNDKTIDYAYNAFHQAECWTYRAPIRETSPENAAILDMTTAFVSALCIPFSSLSPPELNVTAILTCTLSAD